MILNRYYVELFFRRIYLDEINYIIQMKLFEEADRDFGLFIKGRDFFKEEFHRKAKD